MGLLSNVSVGRKLAALSLVGLLSAGVIGVVAYIDVRQIQHQNTVANAMTAVNTEFDQLGMMIVQVQVQVSLRDELLATDDTARQGAVDALAAITRSAQNA